MAHIIGNKNSVHRDVTFLNLSKTLLTNFFHKTKTSSDIKKSIPGKMKCGLAFQHLPESIHMVRHYEIIGEKCKENISQLVNSAKWR